MTYSPFSDARTDRPSAAPDNAGLSHSSSVIAEPKSFSINGLIARPPSVAGTPAQAVGDVNAAHLNLAWWNRDRLGPGVPTQDWRREVERQTAMLLLEGAWIEGLRQEVYEQAHAAPADPDGFVAWFEDLKTSGPGQGDSLFDWLAEEADEAAMRWFLTQEAAGEAGFDDLVALTQVKLPTAAKLELARNYWDEMGRGRAEGMHGPMLSRAIEELGLQPQIATTVWPSLALANTMTAFATVRRYAWHSVGALGVVELTAPGRVAKVGVGLKRLGFPTGGPEVL